MQFDITLNMLFMAYFFMRYGINPIDWSVININELEDTKQDLVTHVWFVKSKNIFFVGDNSEL